MLPNNDVSTENKIIACTYIKNMTENSYEYVYFIYKLFQSCVPQEYCVF